MAASSVRAHPLAIAVCCLICVQLTASKREWSDAKWREGGRSLPTERQNVLGYGGRLQCAGTVGSVVAEVELCTAKDCIAIGTALYREAGRTRRVYRYASAACGLWFGLKAAAAAAAASPPPPLPTSAYDANSNTTSNSKQQQQQQQQSVGSGWFYLGATLALLGDPGSAASAYWEAYAVDPAKLAVLENLGACKPVDLVSCAIREDSEKDRELSASMCSAPSPPPCLDTVHAAGSVALQSNAFQLLLTCLG